NDVVISENTINQLGYRYLVQGKIKEAVELFKLNILFYPDSWNVYDSLAEAYMTDGNKELAVKNYEKSLELNPENSNAVEMLKKLKKE
ncbi:MAG: tetratricopeptide repeat protein, partial [Candidatus Aminicenantaceae bacterium]